MRIAILVFVLSFSLCLNLAYITWGLPGLWHPDEITHRSVGLVVDQTMNPHFFAYPSLHIYLIALLVVLPYSFVQDLSLPGLLPDLTLYSRALTAVMGTLTVFVVYLIARRMFDRTAGVLAAMFLAITAGFIGLSHFATTDIPLTFWMALAFYCCLLALEEDTTYRYMMAGFVLGLAISTKYTAVLLLPTLLLAYFLNTRASKQSAVSRIFNKRIFLLMFAVFLGFVLGTPYAILTPISFLHDFIALNLYQSTYGGIGGRGFVPHLENLFEIFGPFLFLAAVLGFFYILYLLVKNRRPDYLLLLISIIVIYLKMGNMMFYPSRYIVIVVPLLAVCAGKLFSDVISASANVTIARNIVWGILSAGVAFSTYYCLAGIAEIKNDDRVLAHNWVLTHIAKSDTVEMTPAAINIPDGYRTFTSIPYSHYKETYHRMRASPLYQSLKRVERQILTLLQEKKVEQHEPVRIAVSEEQKEPSEASLDALLKRKPKYLLLAERSYLRFLSEQQKGSEYFPLQHELYSAILSGKTPYRLVADFRKHDNWTTPQWEFINAGISIYEYPEAQEVSQGVGLSR